MTLLSPYGVGGCIPKEKYNGFIASPNHEEIAKRLARVAGHANSLPRLWGKHRESDDILTQIAGRVQEAIDRGNADKVIRHLANTLDCFVT